MVSSNIPIGCSSELQTTQSWTWSAISLALKALVLFSLVQITKFIFFGATLNNPEVNSSRQEAAKHYLGVSSEPFSGDTVRVYPANKYLFHDYDPIMDDSARTAKATPDCSGWGVVTTINEPTESVLRMAELSDWCLVVIGDKRTPEPYVLPASSNSFYLGENEQESFCAKFKNFCDGIPWNHFGRKNIGYLYAVAHGAQLVWDFDDDNFLLHSIPLIGNSSFFEVDVLGTDECYTFNPYPHMGGPQGHNQPAWPRGFPLDCITKKCNNSFDEVGDRGQLNIGVVQSLANNEPDVDAIYRLTRGTPFDFDRNQDSWIVLGERVMAPYNAQATLVYQSALWSLFLPLTVHSRVSDIWRSYIAQRLMKDISVSVAFAPPHVDQFRNAHNILGDLKAEEALYHQSPSLCAFLNRWHGSANTLPGRIEELHISLYERGFLEAEDVEMVQKWLNSLSIVGYKFPSLQNKQDSGVTAIIHTKVVPP